MLSFKLTRLLVLTFCSISLHRFKTSVETFQQTRFNRLSDNILDRVDTMGSKIDQLERSINELIDEAGIETPSGGAKKGDGGKKGGREMDSAEL